MAFLEASLRSDKELLDWFHQRLVWSDPAVVNDLLKKGLFMRIYEPQVSLAALHVPGSSRICGMSACVASAARAHGARDGRMSGRLHDWVSHVGKAALLLLALRCSS